MLGYKAREGGGVELGLFYYTLVVMLATIIAGAFCFAAYLVSKKRTMAFIALACAFYFFDVAFVFRDDYLLRQLQSHSLDTLYFIGAPLPSIITGAGTFGFLWLSVCEYFADVAKGIRGMPIALYAIGCLVIFFAVPEGNVHLFVFYSMRFLFAAWTLLYALFRFLSCDDEARRSRMRKLIPAMGLLFALSCLMLSENVVVLLVLEAFSGVDGFLPFYPERNFAENLLMLAIGTMASLKAASLLELRSNSTPVYSALHGSVKRDEGLEAYAHRYGLTEREGEVLAFILQGLDNQNIASTINVAPGTVKVHVHNVLKKTGKKNRKELIRDYWAKS